MVLSTKVVSVPQKWEVANETQGLREKTVYYQLVSLLQLTGKVRKDIMVILVPCKP